MYLHWCGLRSMYILKSRVSMKMAPSAHSAQTPLLDACVRMKMKQIICLFMKSRQLIRNSGVIEYVSQCSDVLRSLGCFEIEFVARLDVPRRRLYSNLTWLKAVFMQINISSFEGFMDLSETSFLDSFTTQHKYMLSFSFFFQDLCIPYNIFLFLISHHFYFFFCRIRAH